MNAVKSVEHWMLENDFEYVKEDKGWPPHWAHRVHKFITVLDWFVENDPKQAKKILTERLEAVGWNLIN